MTSGEIAGGVPAAGGRALVPLGRSGAAEPTPRRLAGFLTQLIACEARLEPYREARRSAPDRASGAYRQTGQPASPAAASGLDRRL